MVARVRDDGCARLDEIAFDLLYEDHASASEWALIGDLLVKAFGWRHRPTRLATALRRRTTVRQRGYTLHPQHYRVLAWAGDQLVGARMVCRPSCDPPRGTSVRFRRCGRPSGLATARNRAGDDPIGGWGGSAPGGGRDADEHRDARARVPCVRLPARTRARRSPPRPSQRTHVSSHLADPLDHRANSACTSQRILISLGAGTSAGLA